MDDFKKLGHFIKVLKNTKDFVKREDSILKIVDLKPFDIVKSWQVEQLIYETVVNASNIYQQD